MIRGSSFGDLNHVPIVDLSPGLECRSLHNHQSGMLHCLWSGFTRIIWSSKVINSEIVANSMRLLIEVRESGLILA
jgi:hypothetical protein